ncbi:TetR family transcriptional regulator [Actinoplanes ianthinogenes]|uniref:TetR family transcriptional regulator n=1 Tax=Actinoplanes ianthinogenes TaxID=122358 RepID=A0ABM7M1S1_9ACTN|nr:TetR/AcrR family transcriptional regulator [Actinoplanes ianthinogenes]BCJ45521.1 TetR family transcriptional regulator [Actinoplanes ianthinogenes]GGR49597.1 TetR family transcriptional regulator [Actinoplanes ianthinogenes]
MQDDSRLQGTRRPGGRTARTRAAVFEAAMAELAENGYAGTRIEAVATRAGVALSTVYRRWGNLDGLIQDLVDEITVELPIPDTGTLEGDLTEVARIIVGLHRHPVHRPWLDALIMTAVRDPASRHTLTETIRVRIKRAATVVDRAVERAEIPAGTCADEAVRMLAAPFYYRIYISGEPIEEDLPERTAARVLAAIRAGTVRSGG